MKYKKKLCFLRYAEPSMVIFMLGGLLPLLIAVLTGFIGVIIEKRAEAWTVFGLMAERFHTVSSTFLIVAIVAIIIFVIVYKLTPASVRICHMVKKGLFCYKNGNPLHLKEGEQLPKVICRAVSMDVFELVITAGTSTVEEIQGMVSSISSSIKGKQYGKYAVTRIDVDMAYNEVRFTIEDVTAHKEVIIYSVEELRPVKPTELTVQKDTYIDLTTSGSMLFCGKTRSGKTTGVISILLQALMAGRDRYGSQIVIIDPKQAELSRLPYVYTLDEDGEAKQILSVIKAFSETITVRQGILNELSVKKGDAVHWWEADMHASLLFIDEYVAMRTIFPKRAGKEDSDYCLATFDALIKRIVTMGASAGCYVIISIAEASVDEGGLPSMLRSAMSTKVLFKPTLTEGRFLWDSEKMKAFPERIYNAGDAWFSSTDGMHDNVVFVHFPVLNFPAYYELGRLLKEYYRN